MSSVNKVILVGNLGADPELRYTGSGKAVCDLRLATSNTWTRDGEKQEATEWHRVVVWDKSAESCAKYLKKGRQAYVEGRIQTRTYDKDGETKYITEIVASDVKFLGGPRDDADTEGEYSSQAEAPEQPEPKKPGKSAFNLKRK